MLEGDLEDAGEVEPTFPLSVTEALSAYTLYSVVLEDVMAGVEEGISRQEIPIHLRPSLRKAIPNLVADLRDFIAEHIAPEILVETDAQIAESRKAWLRS
jgi:hypothetical protein